MIKYLNELSEYEQEAYNLLRAKNGVREPIYLLKISVRSWFVSRTRRDRYAYVTLWDTPKVGGSHVDEGVWNNMINDAYIVQDIGVLPYAHRN